MTDRAIIERVLKIAVDIAGPGRTPDVLGPETQLRDGGLWLDSVGLLELIVAVESEFDIQLDPASDFGRAGLESIRSLAAIVERALAEGA